MSENNLKKCVPIEIPDNNPFQNDVLNRKDNIETLTTFITSFEQSIVLCIDGGWGQGKTTFIKMWEKYLNQQSIPTIYFNAWESDYTDDALIALIGEIDLAAEKLAIQDKNEAEKSINKIYKFVVNFLKATAPTLANLGIKAVSGGLTNTDELTKALSSLSESLVKEQINQYEQSRRTLGNFKEALSELARSYANGNKDTPLVIFIDELDRCRPNFAIQVLEKAKHLFNVDNIIFVLAADKSQLAHSIRAVYGQGLDVNGYLRRFIDFDYLLPSPVGSVYIKYLVTKMGFDKNLNNDETHIYDHQKKLNSIIRLYNLTLREQESFCNILNVVIKTKYHTMQENSVLVFLLIILKIKEPELYKSLNRFDTANIIRLILKNFNAKYTAELDNVNYHIEYLECILLSICSGIKLNSDAPIFKAYIEEYDFNESKKNRLLEDLKSIGKTQYDFNALLIPKNIIEFSKI
ncbi:P-loop NTPase fold protein [Snodgrassella alvi]|uniref:KAP family P-loop NTPase fold protein n=1 Tax=Snodgrassella alvi TaxID=1196083 RepID=UPI00351A3168